MVYLDYSATTPVSKYVLDKSYDFSKQFYANPNSIHKLGKEAWKETQKSTDLILKTLGLDHHDLIYTSGATESNNLALKGYCEANKHLGNHIITTPFEHGSITATLNYLSKHGYVVDIVEMDQDGRVDLEDLESLIQKDTILISIGAVNSELGIVQDLAAIKKVIRQHDFVAFHSDMTQAIGKVKIDYQVVDMLSLSGHKIYGFKGIGGLIVRRGISLLPIIHGGKSLSPLRSGTPPLGLIHSLALAIEQAYSHFDERLNHISRIQKHLVKALASNQLIVLNSNQYAIPHIVNISYLPYHSKDIQAYLSSKDIYVSTTTACSSGENISRVVKALTNDQKRASSSIRISISHLTTLADIDYLIETLEIGDIK